MIVNTITQPAIPSLRPLLDGITSLAEAVYLKISLVLQVRKERSELANLSDEALLDIGINRATAELEASRALLDLALIERDV